MEKEKIMSGKNIGKTLVQILFFVFTPLFIIVGALLAYMRESWPDISYVELMFHLKTSIGGTNPEMIYSALLKYALPAVLAIVVLITAFIVIKKKNIVIYRVVAVLATIFLIVSDCVSAYAYNSRTRIFSDFLHSVFRNNASDFIADIYVDPADVEIEFPEQKRNLIFVYMESMEMSFADESNGGAFSYNIIPELTELAKENEDFSGDSDTLDGGISLPGTQWTTGAMFATTSGLPLDIPVHEGSITNPEQFFPTIVTLGDILKDAGYKNIIEMGSTAGFGGKSAYYRRHGDFEIRDYEYAVEQNYIPSDYEVWWGYEDEKLFEFAEKELTELAQSDTPFNYSMVTVDTHCQDGYVCRLCDDEFGEDQYANVLACSNRQVVDFVRWIQQQDFYENTTIVLTGDHPTMDSDFMNDVSSDYQRKTYTCIINAAATPELDTRREYTTIDLFPTTLAALGVNMSSDRLGCGTNLFGTQQTIVEEYGTDECRNQFAMQSPFVESLVNLKVDEETMKEVQAASYLEVAEENGGTRFRLINADKISRLSVRELKLKVHDNVTGIDYDFNMELEDGRSGWHGMLHSEVPFEDVNDLSCQVYISVDDFDDYLFLDVTSEELGMWDIRWDFE